MRQELKEIINLEISIKKLKESYYEKTNKYAAAYSKFKRHDIIIYSPEKFIPAIDIKARIIRVNYSPSRGFTYLVSRLNKDGSVKLGKGNVSIKESEIKQLLK